MLSDRHYVEDLETALRSADPPDVFYAQPGQKLQRFVHEGLVAPLDDLWRVNDWDHQLAPGLRSAVTVDGHVFALPYSIYPWGIYYRPTLFERLHQPVPDDWAGLLRLCRSLREYHVTPFVTGTRDSWPAAAWFDYLDLRLNGAKFHRRLLLGKVAYTDPRIGRVFGHWKMLIDAQCFNENTRRYDWREVLPYLYHDQAAMVLSGSFVEGSFPVQVRPSFRRFPFPLIDKHVPLAEDAPVDVFARAAHASGRPEQVDALLRWLSGAAAQQMLNRNAGVFSTNVQAGNFDPQLGYARAHLGMVEYMQYFDRDVPAVMSEPATRLFAEFLVKPDIGQTQQALESLRQSAYPVAPRHP